MSDPRQPQGGQPSEEELQAYLQQLRAADVTEILVQAYSMLATAAEVKLGRPDARVVIDAMHALAGSLGGKVDPQLHQQMTQGVAQLQNAQVQVERQVATQQAGQQPGEPAAEPAAPPDGEPEPGTGPGAGPGTGPAGERMTDRLWIPGRDPNPR
jgi:hypothetical protein